MKEDNKSLRFPEETDKKLTKLAERLGHSKRDLFVQMVDYFDKSKKDPADLNDDLLKKDISQGINRIISFIKTQEKDTLSPMLAEVREAHRATLQLDQQQSSQWSKYAGSWNKHLKDRSEHESAFAQFFRKNAVTQKPEGYAAEQFISLQQELASLRSETRKGLETNQTIARREKVLKTAFTELLEAYMGKREALNSLTQGKAVKELQETTLHRIQDL